VPLRANLINGELVTVPRVLICSSGSVSSVFRVLMADCWQRTRAREREREREREQSSWYSGAARLAEEMQRNKMPRSPACPSSLFFFLTFVSFHLTAGSLCP